jgi:hypothetical protein
MAEAQELRSKGRERAKEGKRQRGKVRRVEGRMDRRNERRDGSHDESGEGKKKVRGSPQLGQ